MEDRLDVMKLHKERWLRKAAEKSGLSLTDLTRIYEGITLDLFASTRWPVVDPYSESLDRLRNYNPPFEVADPATFTKTSEQKKRLKAIDARDHLDNYLVAEQQSESLVEQQPVQQQAEQQPGAAVEG